MKKHKAMRYLLITLILIVLTWTILTLWVERQGPAMSWSFGNSAGKKVIIIYDPDPFYNLDEQVCFSLGKAFADNGLHVYIATVAAANKFKTEQFDLHVYCANTYNWRPDWAITKYIREQSSISNKLILAITLGAGSTTTSQKRLENLIVSRGGELLASHSLWLLRPNDESRMKEPNVKVAVNSAYQWGEQIAHKLNNPIIPK